MAVAEWAAAHAHSGMSNVSLLIPAMQPINFLNNLTGNQTCPLDYVVGFSRQEIGKVNVLPAEQNMLTVLRANTAI